MIAQNIHPSYGLNIDAKNISGQNALHVSILNRQANLVKQLLECKASPVTTLYLDHSAMKGYKPIHLACKAGSK